MITVIEQAFGAHKLEPVPVHVAIGTAALAAPQLTVPPAEPTDPAALAQGRALAELELMAAGALDAGIAQAMGFVRIAADPAQAIKHIAQAFGQELRDKGHKAHAQRACDLRAILKAAIAQQDFAPVGGLQVAARQARQIVKARTRAAQAGRKAKQASDVFFIVDRERRRFYMRGVGNGRDGKLVDINLEVYAVSVEAARECWHQFHGEDAVLHSMFVQVVI